MVSNYLYISSRDEFLRIEMSSIVYFESNANYTDVVSANGIKAIIGMNLHQVFNTVSATPKRDDLRFARIGKRYIINLNYIYRINTLTQELVLSDQRDFTYTLKISKEALKNLKELMLNSIEQ